MATIRDARWTSSSTGTQVAITLPSCQVGDTLVVIVGGGNRVTSWLNNGWKYYEYALGQEAQGIVLTKAISIDDTDHATLTVNFDGGDPRSVLAVSVIGIVEISFPFMNRFGTAGQTFASSTSGGFTLDAGKGDVLLSYVFSRNANDVPDAHRGFEFATTAPNENAGCSAAAWTEEMPFAQVYSQDFTYPQRSGHFAIVVQLWEWDSRTAVDHEYDINVTSLWAGAAWDPTTHTLTSPKAASPPIGDTMTFNIFGAFEAYPIVGLRIEQRMYSGYCYLLTDWNPISTGTDFGIDNRDIWQFGSAYGLTAGDWRHSITSAFSNGSQFSVSEMVRRAAYSPTPLVSMNLDSHNFAEQAGINTTIRIFAYEQPRVIFTPMAISGAQDSYRVRQL